MKKRDLFVIIYSVVCASLGVILATLNYFNHWIENSTFVLIWNSLFLTITSSFVFIKPIGQFFDNHIISLKNYRNYLNNNILWKLDL